MSPEDIQTTIEQMLKIQKELQQTQINLQQTQIAQSEEIKDLIAQGKEQDRRIQQLIGYSISQAGDVIDVQMALRNIYARLSKLESKNDLENENN